MRVVIAPDKFKGSLSAPEAAAALERGLLAAAPGLAVAKVPVADGGEGTLEAAFGAGYARHEATVTGPTGEPLVAAFAVRGRQAVIEMAAASGLAVLPGGQLQARTATSRGTGELVRAALDAGCTQIVLGIGGSASTDGGAGLLAGLGARLLDAGGSDLPEGGAALASLAAVDLSGLDRRLERTEIVLASDVDNPLLGANGAAAVFGPQKGASAADVAELDAALARFVEVLAAGTGGQVRQVADSPGAGAAGGVGFAAMAVLGARRSRGIDVVMEMTQLKPKIEGAALVVTGEGSLDLQSLEGKAPVGVAALAAAAGVPVAAVCGRTLLTGSQLEAAGFVRTYALTDLEADPAECMANAAALLEETGRKIAHHLLGAGSPAGTLSVSSQRGDNQ
ncbi:glycerate kinase [Arthrobacter mobilis]|uniref:Glycerate kinase n=1 Tax=Arthrobacter mobilis TaxID=2724944 RepID=A0A7X6QML5_9MICC|nr:glycerate kinase [Arthrobacter mobilis]NKX56748.1 glycerate kinase [Arthrobacter mobilis]